MEQDQLINDIESSAQQPATQQPSPAPAAPPVVPKPIPQEARIEPKGKRSFLDTATKISYIVLALATAIIAILLILGNLK